MPSYDIKQLQSRLLDILIAFDKVCREHNLRYCICGGTLLGAVRHGGFIPWDDDLDCSMPRPDYERFIAHCREWLPEHLEFVCAENDPLYPLPFGKIQDARTTLIERRHLYYLGGCYIDIFPFDAHSDNTVMRHWRCARYNYLSKMLYFVHRDPYRHGHGMSSWVPRLARKLYTMNGIQKSIRQILTKEDYDARSLASSFTDGAGKVLPKSVIGTFKPYMFEGHEVMGIADYDTYLRCMYGPNYMTPPPPEDRFQHNFDYLDLEHPYRDYHPAE